MRVSSNEFIHGVGTNLLRIEVLQPGAEDKLVLTYDDLTSFTYSADGTSSSAIQFGYASICTVDFSIYNTSGEWDFVSFAGAKLDVFIGRQLEAGDEYVKLGVFTVDKSPKKDSIIHVTASDNMALLDAKFKGISFPCTLKDVIQRLCDQVGINLATSGFTNFSTLVDSLESLTSKTCREVLSLCCELAGSFAIINSDGDLEIKWFDTSKIDFDLDELLVSEFSPDITPTPKGLSAELLGEEFVYGDIDALMHLTDNNPLVDNLSKEQANDLVGTIYESSISRLSYNVGTASLPGVPVLEPGDVVSLSHKGQRYILLVGTFKLSGNLKMTITSPSLGTSSKPYSSGASGSAGGTSELSFKSTHIISYEDAVVPFIGPGSDQAKEIIALPIAKLGNHVPVSFVTTTFECQSTVSQNQYVKFDLAVGSTVVYTAYERCFMGKNTLSFSWPLEGIPDGQTRIRLLAESFSGLDGVSPPTLTWRKGDTSLLVMGRGFNASINQWNGLIMVTDTAPHFEITNFDNSFTRLVSIRESGSANTKNPMTNSITITPELFTVENFKQDITFKGVASTNVSTSEGTT